MIPVSGLSVKFLKKEPYSGSYGGMRYHICVSGEMIAVYVYPEPWCFEKTPDEDKIKKEFPFTSEGVTETIEWLNFIYRERKNEWDTADKEKMMRLLL